MASRRVTIVVLDVPMRGPLRAKRWIESAGLRIVSVGNEEGEAARECRELFELLAWLYDL